MRAARLHDVRVLGGLRVERVGELVELLAHRLRELEMREAHRGGGHVIRRLAHVHVVVRVHVLVRAEAAAEDLVRAICDDLVHVHVERDAGSGVKDIEHELVGVRAVQDLVARGDDGVPSLVVQPTGLGVGDRLGLLDADHGPDEGEERPVAADRIVLDAPLCLGAPEGVCRNGDLAESVLLGPAGRGTGTFRDGRHLSLPCPGRG